MVFLSQILMRRFPVYINNVKENMRGPHRFWKKRRILSLAGHFYGRRRRSYAFAIRGVHRSFLHLRNAQKIRRLMLKRTWETRLDAACQEFDLNYNTMRKVLNDSGVGLDRKILQTFAIWEPRTFRGLAMLTKAKSEVKGINSLEGPPKGVILRGML